ncbi:armadillo-like helical domain-containing protein 3 isoform X2 [Taeniopygia guttata]|uniref:armadillo-like helical domain-containing protein 3 isoform X2 n=1 Tax=Taeniopygia guttata TaxID=59729 RepID=UPI003BB974F3
MLWRWKATTRGRVGGRLFCRSRRCCPSGLDWTWLGSSPRHSNSRSQWPRLKSLKSETCRSFILSATACGRASWGTEPPPLSAPSRSPTPLPGTLLPEEAPADTSGSFPPRPAGSAAAAPGDGPRPELPAHPAPPGHAGSPPAGTHLPRRRLTTGAGAGPGQLRSVLRSHGAAGFRAEPLRAAAGRPAPTSAAAARWAAGPRPEGHPRVPADGGAICSRGARVRACVRPAGRAELRPARGGALPARPACGSRGRAGNGRAHARRLRGVRGAAARRVYSMAQTEKKGGLLRKSSASKKPLKEKVVLMYDEIFMIEDPSKCNPRFWEELFLMKVNLEYLEGKLEALDGEELMKIKDNINCLFQHCIQALGEEHPIRVVNALQTLCALIRGVHQKNKSTSGFDIINMLVGFDKAELCMKNLMESLDSLLCAEGSESLKSLCLKLLLCLVTVTDNISQNTILEYVMINSIFEAILQILSSPLSRREHGYDAVVLLALLVNYRKYESVNPYIVKLSIVDDEATLNGMGLVIAQALSEYNRQYKDKEEEHQTGFFSALTNMVGSMFIADADEKISVQTNEAILLALYEAVHLNRNFITVLAQSHPEMGLMTSPTSPVPTTPVTPLGTTPPSSDVISSAELPLDADVQTSNLLITFLKYSSIVMQDTKDEHRLHSGKLCLIILTCIAEDQYANAFLHDDNMNFRVNLHRMPMRHRKKAADKNLPCRPLVCAVLDLMVEFIVTHMMKEFPMDLYVRCIQIVHKLLCYQKKCRVRLHYTWRELWSALINLLKFLMSNETVLLAKHNIFTLALMVVNLFNMFITYGDTFLPTPSSYDELYYEIIRMHQNFDNLYSMVLRLSTNAGQWKEPASKVTHALVNIRAIINHFNPKIESYAAVNHISQLSEDQVLEVVRSNYDTLTLKLQDGLDQYERYSEQHKEAAFFKELVRSISINVRKNLAFNTLSQELLLKEFSTIS